MTDVNSPVLEIRAGTKRYQGVAAIEGVDLALHPGQIHALVGENGAGKSTLCKVISGAVALDGGSLLVGGEERSYRHPAEALDDGISMVYQETSLVPTMTVAQNIFLGEEPRFTRFRHLNVEARQLLQTLNFNVPVANYVSSIGSAQRTMVEITRALRRKARIVIFDEPTATLTPEERAQLFMAIRRLAREGAAVLFVSHALEDCFEIASRISVLRDGVLQGTKDTDSLTRADVVKLMVGREVEQIPRKSASPVSSGARPVLSVDGLQLGNVVRGMSFSVFAGEVVGLAGLVGSGRTETAHVIAGLRKRNRVNGGRVLLEGRPVRYRVPRNALRDGIVYVTEDRKINGFFDTMSVAANIYLGSLASGRRHLWVSRSTEHSVAERFISRFRISSINGDAKVIELSGGNQQKVVLAKALTADAKVVIFDEPTHGVDVGAIDEIHQMIRDVADSGVAVILISSYLPEVLAMSDRVLVARAGRVAAELSGEDATEEAVMFAAVH